MLLKGRLLKSLPFVLQHLWSRLLCRYESREKGVNGTILAIYKPTAVLSAGLIDSEVVQ